MTSPGAERWAWDPTLYAGSAAHYEQGRLPYPSGLADAMAAALGLDGTGRLLDLGCGPGIVALRVAHLVEEVVGLDADAGMVAVAERRAGELGVANARWVAAKAEALGSLALGTFRVVTLAQSFHWMERELVAATLRRVLDPGGAVVQVDGKTTAGVDEPTVPLPHPQPPRAALRAVVERWLGPAPRAGKGVRHRGPSGEAEVFAAAGFAEPATVTVPGGEVVVRTADDVVASMWSLSTSAPHLFGSDLPAVEAELRAVLAEASSDGRFAEQLDDTDLVVYRVRSEPG